MVNHDQYENQLWSIMVKHGHPWSNVTLRQRLFEYENFHGQPMSTMVKHGLTSHFEKAYLDMKINHGQPCLFKGL